MQRLIIVQEKTGREIEAWAVDFGGNQLAVYIEEPPTVDERPVGWSPTFICPDCAGGVLKQGSGVGPNNSMLYYCQNKNCGIKWKRSDNMMPGVVLESA